MQLTPILTLIVQVGLIIMACRLMGLLFARLRQPQVLGEMVAGLILGPTVLGWAMGGSYADLFPPQSVKHLELLSQLGLIFFLFLIGLELDPRLLRAKGRASLQIGAAGLALPLALGCGLGLVIYSLHGIGTNRSAFEAALFLGAAMTVASFPVKARILTERNLHRSELGILTIACAAFNDLAAWCILAGVIAFAGMTNGPQTALIIWLTAVFVIAMLYVVRPFLSRLEIIYDRGSRLSQNVVAIVFLLILASAYAAAASGTHALFGAFLLGWVMPKGTPFVRHLSEKFEDYTIVFLLPIFFAVTGFQTDLREIFLHGLWGWALVILAVAIVGKMGGAALAARASGVAWRESAALGLVLNTRGIMALVVIGIGLELDLMSKSVHAMMVIMTLITTAMTTPLLNWIYPRTLTGIAAPIAIENPTAEESESPAPPRGMSIVIPVSLPKSGGPLVQLADTLIGADKDHSKLYAIHVRKPVDHEAYRSGLDEASVTHDMALAPLLAQARGRSIRVEQASFVSNDVAGDISRVAKMHHADLVLMGFHKPVIGKTILGGTVHRVLTACECDVAIFVDRGFRTARRILVPYLGSEHDRLALALAAKMSRSTDAQVTVLHVVPPMSGREGGSSDGARNAVDRVFHAPGHDLAVTFRVVEDESPVGVVLHQAQSADLVIIGVAEEWGLESHLFGWRAQRIARDCPSSLLIVRKCEAKAGEASQ